MTSSLHNPFYDELDYTGCVRDRSHTVPHMIYNNTGPATSQFQMEKIYTASDYDEYYEDFHWAMRRTELQQARHMMRSPQLESRVKLIEFARTLCTSRSLARTTLHLSCHIIDRFMDLFEVAEERLRMFAAVCVLIAAKLEDRSDCVPRWSELQPLFERQIETREYAILECMIINALQWKLSLPTAASFLEYYIVGSITISDVPIRLRTSRPHSAMTPNSQVYPALRLQMYNLVYYLLDLSLNDLQMIGMRPSKLAAATILCARQIMDYRPFWNTELQHLTDYGVQDDVFSLASKLRMLYVALNSCKRGFPFGVDLSLLGRAKRMRD